MSDEEDEKVEVVVAGHGGLRVDSLTGQRKGGAPLNSERLAKMPLQSGQSTITAAFKKQKTGAATKAAAKSTHSGALSSLAQLTSPPLMGSSGSTSKRQRGIGGDGVGGYHHEVLLPPSKDAAKEASGVEALSGAVEHIAAAVASKVETSVGEVVDRATVQLKENVGRVFDKAQQEAEARLAKLKAEVAELEKRQGARSQDTLLLDPDIMQLSSGRVVCKVCTENRASLVHLTNQADARGEIADFFIQRALRKLRGKENEKREGKEKERKRGAARLLAAIWRSEKRAEAIF